MTVRIGVIGTGVMGTEHARLLSSVVAGSEVAAVFDLDTTRADRVADDTGARRFDDPMALIEDGAVDAVLVASADPTHEEFTLASLDAGKPVLCEKPLAPDIAGCCRILDAEIAVGRRLLTVGFMRRYDPGYLALKQALTSGELGATLMLHCIHRNATSGPGLSSELLISGSAIHEIDIARWLLDEELTSVTVHRPRPSSRSGGAQDPLLLVLSSDSGVLVDIEVFVNADYGYEVRCELVGERGTVQLDSPQPVLSRLGGRTARAVPADWRPRFAEAYRRELQEWIDDVAAGRPGRGASAWDGFVATAVAGAGIAALEAGDSQKLLLPERPPLYA